uniref:hypothetical protein n=1 Tax=Streptomyces achromogenes TaxID=67255 RepID=UPI003F499E14
MDAMHGRIPADVYQTVVAELNRRKPQELTDRIERRWYGRWVHALRELDEDKRPVWTADQIALHLVYPAPCLVPECEDGVLLTTNRVCPQCQHPEHSFRPASAGAASERTRQAALAAMRQAVMASPHRTAAGAERRVSPRRPMNADAMDRALQEARTRLADPSTPRLIEPPPRPEPGATDSIILAAREERQAQRQDPIRQAALARARRERSLRLRQGK